MLRDRLTRAPCGLVAPASVTPLAGLVLVCLLCAQCGTETPTGPTELLGPTTSEALPPTGPTPSFPPLAPSAGAQVFVGAGDIAVCGSSDSQATAMLLATIGGTVFTLGDNAYFNGTTQEFRDCYQPTWGAQKSRTFPSPGNHEYRSAGATPYFEYFGANAGPPGLGYYSIPLGDWQAISLNSNVPAGTGSAQAQWLRQNLTSNPTRCAVAYWHHPLFSSGPNGDNPGMRDVWRILYDFGADVVLNGHDHLYERFAPQDPDGLPDPARGIRQFIVGTGGAPLYQFVTVRANSEVRFSTHGVLKLTLRADSYEWEFIPVLGPRDFGTGSCH